MLILRPCRAADLDAVLRIAAASGIGITSLPTDPAQLLERIERSARSFATGAGIDGEGQGRGDELYFFVLEDPASGDIAGTSGIVASAGFREPFYSYRHEVIIHASQQLGVSNRIHALHLCHDLTGSTLLTSFFIKPEYAASDWPQLLSRARLLFIAEQGGFAERIAAEHPGECDDRGRSPFWDAVGRRFFNIEYPQAERLSGGRNKTFIAELMPQYPIYVPLLPPDARNALGRLHPRAVLPHSILCAEGFDTGRYVDIFDGGPTVDARTATLRSIAGSRRVIVRRGPVPANAGADTGLIASTGRDAFRASIGPLAFDGDRLLIDPQMADALGLADGDPARVVAL